jgi:uncharacterized protein YmfQ (DUF2313 family)
MSDRHVRRPGADYGTAFLALLLQGPAWPRDPGTTLDLACRGLAEYWGFVDSRAADLLEQESDPRLTLELLPDWERNWGLPDPCYTAPQTISERQRALVQRMTIEGAQSRAFFIEVAAYIGYTISISEYRPFIVGIDRVGDSRTIGTGVEQYNEWHQIIVDPLGKSPIAVGALSEWPSYGIGVAQESRFYWTVHVADAKLVWFRVTSGQTGVDPHLRIGLADDLECLLNRWKPAHTIILFDYSGLDHPSDPMAGTP